MKTKTQLSCHTSFYVLNIILVVVFTLLPMRLHLVVLKTGKANVRFGYVNAVAQKTRHSDDHHTILA